MLSLRQQVTNKLQVSNINLLRRETRVAKGKKGKEISTSSSGGEVGGEKVRSRHINGYTMGSQHDKQQTHHGENNNIRQRGYGIQSHFIANYQTSLNTKSV